MSRSMDTKLEVVDGAVKITAGMKVTKLEAPFDTSTSVPVADSFSPDISALVDTVGIVFGIVIPFSSGVSNDRKILFIFPTFTFMSTKISFVQT